eukprot:CAMPEP_0197855944 /NCGR_PEP_ID=MMETSP1438-20131217/27551_1 /TAXON_ID=1461541 /ORGANISM="Pterosperma sp., Strain CCMP1384" /LENGTH=174 /DNA_ID=CAMNT_0043471209 /DNA_START=72 /DNA_END=596 /DNA_ORIENTATION=+
MERLKINGEPAHIAEDSHFWEHLQDDGEVHRVGERTKNVIEFNFVAMKDQQRDHAALTIQANFRAFKNRRELVKYKWAAAKVQVYMRQRVAQRQMAGFTMKTASMVRDEVVYEMLWPGFGSAGHDIKDITTKTGKHVRLTREVRALTIAARLQKKTLDKIDTILARNRSPTKIS